jgi:hypothetical protein
MSMNFTHAEVLTHQGRNIIVCFTQAGKIYKISLRDRLVFYPESLEDKLEMKLALIDGVEIDEDKRISYMIDNYDNNSP